MLPSLFGWATHREVRLIGKYSLCLSSISLTDLVKKKESCKSCHDFVSRARSVAREVEIRVAITNTCVFKLRLAAYPVAMATSGLESRFVAAHCKTSLRPLTRL